MKTGRYMQNCYPFSKFDGLVSERRSLFWVREFVPYIIEKILLFRENGYEHWYTLWEGAFYQSVYKAYAKISLSILCVLCLFFLYVVVVIALTRFHGPHCLGTLYWYFHFCGNHEGHNNWPKLSHSKTPQIANCMHKSGDAPCMLPAVVG